VVAVPVVDNVLQLKGRESSADSIPRAPSTANFKSVIGVAFSQFSTEGDHHHPSEYSRLQGLC